MPRWMRWSPTGRSANQRISSRGVPLLMTPRDRRIFHYAVAVVAVAVASALSIDFAPLIHGHRYAPFLFAVIVSSFVGGAGPSALATIAGIAILNYADYRIEHVVRLDSEDVVQLLMFTSVGLSISILNTRRNAELRRLDRAKDQLIATITHELKTPVTVILGYATLLQHNDDEDLRITAAKAIEQSARAQARLIEDLLDMSRLLLGKIRLEVAPVSLAGILHQVIEMVCPEVERRGLTIDVSIPRDTFLINGDSIRLQQIFWNLLTNALKFTQAGGHIAVEAKRIASTTIEVSVKDSGEGITAAELPRIFDPLQQADAGLARGGLGLGLAIVKQLVAMHRGTVEAYSDGRGSGAMFAVRLPAA